MISPEASEEYIRQMREYMATMGMLPPVPRTETPAQMRHTDTALEALMRRRCEQIQGNLNNRLNERMWERTEYPLNRRHVPQIDWNIFGNINTKKKQTVVPERKTMNLMSLRIYRELREVIIRERGSNAWMAYAMIIEERLIANDVYDNNSNDGNVYYTTCKGKIEIMKLGRFIKRRILKENVLPENIFQESIEGLVNHFFPVVVFRIDSGDAITRNYEQCVGGGSCMAGRDSDKVAMYADNPKCFSQLIATQNRVTGRAILFHMDSGHTMLGNIYCGSSYVSRMMESHAKEQGWIVYEYDSDRFYSVLKHKDETISSGSEGYDFTISGVRWKEGSVPYMDDFANGSVQDDGTLTLYYDRGADHCLQSTCGFLEDGTYCHNCDEAFAMDNMHVFADYYYCPDCYDECFTTCSDCEETVRYNDMYSTKDGEVCETCYFDNYVECGDCHHYVESDDTTAVEGDEVVCSKCLENNYTKCEECDEYSTDCSQGEDDRELCKKCKELEYAETE